MAGILEQFPSGARVAVIRLRSLGDCVLTTPALEILKRARPDLSLAVVVENRFAAVFEGNPDVDALLPPGGLRGWWPRLCLNLHGGTRSLALTVGSGARIRAGFAHYRYSRFYNVRIPTAQEILGVERKVHTAEHLAAAMFYLGAARAEIPPAKLFAAAPDRSPYAVLHPAASAPEKTWPAERFAAVAEHLRRGWGLEPVIIGGARDDLTPFGGFRTFQGAPLSEVKRLMRGAAVFVGNDSGPAHVAAAFQVPSVAIFGASDPEIWRPWKAPAQVLSAPGGIAEVTVADVCAALERLRVAA
jgi:ADP-heptose:LPS heptosyltransferase